MKDEIFGPILPILSYQTDSDLEKIILSYDKPLSLYVFSENDDFSKKIILPTPFDLLDITFCTTPPCAFSFTPQHEPTNDNT